MLSQARSKFPFYLLQLCQNILYFLHARYHHFYLYKFQIRQFMSFRGNFLISKLSLFCGNFIKVFIKQEEVLQQSSCRIFQYLNLKKKLLNSYEGILTQKIEQIIKFPNIFIKRYAMSKSYVEFVKSAAPKVICVGKNYLKHVIQMGGSEIPKEPMLFLKPWSSVSYVPKNLSLPISNKHRIDHELQLGVFISKAGTNISKEKAMEHVGGYFLALDLTDRDFQKVAKEKGFPWTLAKGQDNFCPVSEFIPLGINPYNVELHLRVNQQTKQKDITGNMHFKIDELISYCSQYISLTEGDLILTGTPEGVGPIKVGDFIEGTASQDGKILAQLKFKVTQ